MTAIIKALLSGVGGWLVSVPFKDWLYAAAIIACVSGGVWIRGELDASEIQRLKDTEALHTAAAVAAAQSQCQANNLITWSTSNAFQTDSHAIANRVAADMQRLPAEGNCHCVPAPAATGGHNAGTPGTERAGLCGADIRSLLSVAGQCDQWKAQLSACQSFIRAERAPR